MSQLANLFAKVPGGEAIANALPAIAQSVPYVAAVYQATKAITSWGGQALGLDAGQQRRANSAANWGLGAIPSLVIGALDEGDRPQAQADIVLKNGQFQVVGSRQGDEGPLSEIQQLASAITGQLNSAAQAFGLDLRSVAADIYAGVGYVKGKDSEALGQGFYGGMSNQSGTLSGLRESTWDAGFHSGFTNTGVQDSAELAGRIVKETFLRALQAAGDQLSEAEQRIIAQSETLEEAAGKIQLGRGLSGGIDDAILELTDNTAFQRKKALEAVESSYGAMKAQAEELIAAGLVTGDVLAKLDTLRQLQIDDVLERFGTAVTDATDALGLARADAARAASTHPGDRGGRPPATRAGHGEHLRRGSALAARPNRDAAHAPGGCSPEQSGGRRGRERPSHRTRGGLARQGCRQLRRRPECTAGRPPGCGRGAAAPSDSWHRGGLRQRAPDSPGSDQRRRVDGGRHRPAG